MPQDFINPARFPNTQKSRRWGGQPYRENHARTPNRIPYTTPMSIITGTDVHDMTGHWLATPTNGYLGSGYGQDIKALLQNPQASGQADEYLAKLREDVPVLQVMPAGSANLYGVHSQPDRLDLVLEIAGTAFTLKN